MPSATAGGIGPLPSCVEVASNQTFVLAYKMWWDVSEPDPYGEGYFTCSILLEVNSTKPHLNFTYEGYVCAWANGTEIPLQKVLVRRPPLAPDEILLSFARTEPVEDDGVFWLNVTIRAAGQQEGHYVPNVGGEQRLWTVVIRVIEGPEMKQLGPEPIVVNVMDPYIGIPFRDPEIPNEHENVTISVDVFALSGIRNIILSYTIDDGLTWMNVTMNKAEGNTYTGEIPGFAAGTNVSYMVIAYDNGNKSAIRDNQGKYYVYTVIPEFPAWTLLLLMLLVISIAVAFLERKCKFPLQSFDSVL